VPASDKPHPDSTSPEATGSRSRPAEQRSGDGRPRKPARAILGTMRIRKKLILLHTAFSAGLAALMFFLLRPAIQDLVRQAEAEDAAYVLSTLDVRALTDGRPQGSSAIAPGITLRWGGASELGLSPSAIAGMQRAASAPVPLAHGGAAPEALGSAGLYLPHAAGGRYFLVDRRLAGVRASVQRLDIVLLLSMLGVYLLIAAALEIFVLPRHVYQPIRRMLHADLAVQQGDRDRELIDPRFMPEDEIGEIMRSRNRSIAALRRNEAELARTLAELERVAGDLKRKNHLLENARRNLADADRLASLGMLSAGVAHEINTPLAVLKGLVIELQETPGQPMAEPKARLMRRVVDRLERLGENLLDFARVRSPRITWTGVSELVDQAMELLGLDDPVRRVSVDIRLPGGANSLLRVPCDADRMVQVLVNLIRNAAEALVEANVADPRITIGAEALTREGSGWISITVRDNGPGIPKELLPSLLEPFVSSRLDAKGTGLGLAVADGIVREHGGVLIARNATAGGAEFEVLLPAFERAGQDNANAPG
jgi:signal transduction histidine kinase